MTDGETIKDYSSRVIELVNQLKASGDNIIDQRVVERMSVNLAEKFEMAVTVIEESKHLSMSTISELIGSLQVHENRMSRRHETSLEGAFQSKHKLSSSRSNKNKGPRQYNSGNNKEGEKKGKFYCKIWKNKIIKKGIVGIKESYSVISAKNLVRWSTNADLKGNKQACLRL